MAIREFIDRLASAGAQMQWTQMAVISEEILTAIRNAPQAARSWTTMEVGKLLDELRKKRQFEAMENISDALFELGRDDLIIQRQRVQALVDQGDVEYALEAARGLTEATAGRPDHPEFAEAFGLLGRVLKQSYVDARRPGRSARRHLAEAVQAYLRIYRGDENEHHWHGINVVACLARAERDGVDVDCAEDWRQIAVDIRRRIQDLHDQDSDNPYNMWAWASAMEASVALDDFRDAGHWLSRYLGCPIIDEFELFATHRQLVEVWQLGTSGGSGAQLLLPLRGALASKTGGHVELGEYDVPVRPDEELQAVWGADAFKEARWFDRLYDAMNAVARVERRSGSAVGTAFMVDSEQLNEEWSGQRVVVTAAHVVDDPPHETGVHPNEARLNFTRHSSSRKGDRYRTELVWSGRSLNLDVAVLAVLDAPEDIKGLKVTDPSHLDITDGQPHRLFVIGHPRGREMAISLYDNLLDSIEDEIVNYRSPTEEGSSGSPVLDEEHLALAVHRLANTKKKVNVGVLVQRVRERIREHFRQSAARDR